MRSWSEVFWRNTDYFLFTIALFILFTSSSILSVKAEGQLYLLSIEHLQLEDLLKSQNKDLEHLMEKGALGLMNTRTGDSYERESAYVTIGAGRRALGGGGVFNILQGENGEEVYLPQYKSLYTLNEKADYEAIPGLLGSYLQENLVERILVTTSRDLSSALLLIDREGRVPVVYQEHIHSTLNKEKTLSFLFEEVLKRGDLLLFHLSSLLEVEELLPLLLKELDPTRDRLLLFSPIPSQKTLSSGSNLTPILTYGQGVESGLLSSKSTRQRALVTNLDLLPTILDFFAITPHKPLIGGVLEVIPGSMTWNEIHREHKAILFNATYRPLFIKFFVFFQIILLSLFFLLFLWRSLPLKGILFFLCRLLFSIPSVFLLLGLISGESIYLYLLLFLLLSLSMASLLPLISVQPLDHTLMFTSLTVSLILFDLLWGPYLLSRSILGYDPIIGARFYGIGNEYMGILLGSSIMGGVALWDRLPHLSLFYYTLLFFLSITLFMGLPFLGANLGGTLTALFLFSLALFLLKGDPFTFKGLLIVLSLLLLLLLTLFLLETSLLRPSQSHIGKTLELLRRGGWQEIYPIIIRKLGMNLKLMRWTIWTRVLLSFTLFFVLFFNQPYGLMKRTLRDHPHLGIGLKTAVFGSLVTMVVNDSGVVAMATLLFFPVFTIFYLILHTLHQA